MCVYSGVAASTVYVTIDQVPAKSIGGHRAPIASLVQAYMSAYGVQGEEAKLVAFGYERTRNNLSGLDTKRVSVYLWDSVHGMTRRVEALQPRRSVSKVDKRTKMSLPEDHR